MNNDTMVTYGFNNGDFETYYYSVELTFSGSITSVEEGTPCMMSPALLTTLIP